MQEKAVVFGLSANPNLVSKICEALGTKPGEIQVSHFADEETMVEIEETVRGKKVFFVQSTFRPVNEKLMELLIAVDAAKRASAKEITVVMPYFGYARQDRKARQRQPITAKLVANLLMCAGIDRIVTVDLHTTQIQGFFDIPADDLGTAPMMAAHFKTSGYDLSNTVVVSPDHGGTTRARNLAELIEAPLAIIDKRRPRPNVCEANNVIGDVEGKDCIVVDDICDTGGSLIAGCKLLQEKGARNIYACITHPVLSGNAAENIEASCIKKMIVSDTIPLTEKTKAKTDKFEVVSTANLLAQLIEAVADDNPVSDVYKKYAKVK